MRRLGHEEAWERRFGTLKKFKAREGHCELRKSHLEGTFKLGQWVAVQRYSKDIIAADRKRRLDAIGFVWDLLERRWEKDFAALKKFKAREGHCLVPYPYSDGNGSNLGHWVNTQRNNKNKMSAERQMRLTKIGFVWNVFERWDAGVNALKKFKARKSHCFVQTHTATERASNLDIG
jgi:hypothetical protein